MERPPKMHIQPDATGDLSFLAWRHRPPQEEPMNHVETVIIGAGQAGLSTAYHLEQRGRECVVLDRNQRMGDGWRQQWDSLKLSPPAKYDGLPGMPFPAEPWSFPGKDDVADYL